MSIMRTTCFAALLVAAAGTARAQQPAAAPAPAPGEPRLVFEREVYSYPGAVRRDPFRQLSANDDGPMFQELQLRMILFSRESPSRSVALIQDSNKKTHRLRRGESVGNATVVDIGARRVVFSVEELGMRRQEVLELTPTNREGA